MASAHSSTGNVQEIPAKGELSVSPEEANRTMATALCHAMRVKKVAYNHVEDVTGIVDRRIESLRSFRKEEEVPIYLSEVLALAEMLGAAFVSRLFPKLHVVDVSGDSPEKIGAEIMELARKLGSAEG